MSIDKGMFNFQDVMSKFYNYQPGADDDQGRAIKQSFMSNMIQSGFDANMAKDMAYSQSEIAKGNMLQAADLELRNTGALMNDEFNKGTLNMGAQFEFQNRFAEDQNVRDITKDTTAGATNFEFGNRYAENQNVRDITKDSIGRSEQFEYNNQMAENQNVRDVTKDTFSQGAAFDYTDKLEDNRNIRAMALEGFKGDEGRKNLAASGTQNRLDMVVQGEQQRYGMMQQGDEQRRTDSNTAQEGRQTMSHEFDLGERKQAANRARSRSGARSF